MVYGVQKVNVCLRRNDIETTQIKSIVIMEEKLKCLRLPFLVWFILVIIMSVIKCS